MTLFLPRGYDDQGATLEIYKILLFHPSRHRFAQSEVSLFLATLDASAV